MRARSFLWMPVFVALGCKDPAPPPPSPSATATNSASHLAPCAKRAQDLGAWLATLKDEGAGPPVSLAEANVDLVPRTDGDVWAWHGAAVLLSGSAVQLDREKIGAPSEPGTQQKLVTAFKSRAQVALSAGVSLGLDVYVDAKTPWGNVVATLDAAAGAGFRTVGFVFAAPAKLEAPSSALLGELAKADETGGDDDPLAPATTGPADKALASCRPAVSVLQEIGTRDLGAREKVEFFAKRAPGSWQACGCRADDQALRSLAWHWSGRGNGPPTRAITVMLGTKADKETSAVSAAKSDLWSKVAEKVVAAAATDKRVVLAAE